MNTIEQKQPIGSLKISREVLATVAGEAAREVAGVHALAGAGVDLRGIVHGQLPRAVTIAINDDIAVIDVRLILESSARIPVVAQHVQSAVKEAVQNMTGVTVSKVNIIAAGVYYEPVQEEEAAD